MFAGVSLRSVVFTGAAVVACALVAGCGSGGSSTPTSTSTQVPTASNPSASVTGQATGAMACPVPQSGTCLGKLTAGQYTFVTFKPKLTFRVTNGWANYLDISGLYLLQSPSAQLPATPSRAASLGSKTASHRRPLTVRAA
jgi:hypothetical protein